MRTPRTIRSQGPVATRRTATSSRTKPKKPPPPNAARTTGTVN